jgi:outer membrane lipoprotein
MRKGSLAALFFAAVPLLTLTGCASPISQQVRQEAAKNLSFSEVLANPGAYNGKIVIWGGVIVKTVSRAEQSDLYLSETPLELSGRPRGREYSEGEFVAKTSESLDPKTYAAGRTVTIAGEIIGQELGSYRGAPYAYPVIRVKELHLWEETPPLRWEWWKIPYYSPYRFTPQQYQQQPPLR